MSTARVDFTRGAAERIAAVVRRVEQGDRDGAPLGFGRAFESEKALRLATFTGNWQTSQFKTVTFYNVTSTPNTARVLNLCKPALGFSTANTSEQRFVIFGKVRYTADLVAVEIQEPGTVACVITLGGTDLSVLPGFVSDKIQMLGHNESACLQWYSITTCTTTSV